MARSLADKDLEDVDGTDMQLWQVKRVMMVRVEIWKFSESRIGKIALGDARNKIPGRLGILEAAQLCRRQKTQYN